MSELPNLAAQLDAGTDDALRRGDLITAADYAERKARLNRASRWYDAPAGESVPGVPTPEPLLSRGKLRHDIEQLRYLERHGILPEALPSIIDDYQEVVGGIGSRPFDRRSLTATERSLIGDVYGRILWKAHAPRSPAALSHAWSRDEVQRAYIDHPVGVVTIDNFLTPNALATLRQFCNCRPHAEIENPRTISRSSAS